METVDNEMSCAQSCHSCETCYWRNIQMNSDLACRMHNTSNQPVHPRQTNRTNVMKHPMNAHSSHRSAGHSHRDRERDQHHDRHANTYKHVNDRSKSSARHHRAHRRNSSSCNHQLTVCFVTAFRFSMSMKYCFIPSIDILPSMLI